MSLTTLSLLWFVAGVIFFLLEMAVPGFVLFFFGVGAWITALLTFFLPLGLNAQILIFIVSSVITLGALRKMVKRAFIGTALDSGGDDAKAEKGLQVEVLSDIVPPAEGKVKYSGAHWRAVSDVALKSGELAEIVEQQGLILKVTAADTE